MSSAVGQPHLDGTGAHVDRAYVDRLVQSAWHVCSIILQPIHDDVYSACVLCPSNNKEQQVTMPTTGAGRNKYCYHQPVSSRLE